jgi:hypothetical protein
VAILQAGYELIPCALEHLTGAAGDARGVAEGLAHDFPDAAFEVDRDVERYWDDLKRATAFTITLPRRETQHCKTVPGLWIDQPSSSLFKAFARGDRHVHTEGWQFLVVRTAPDRVILSVPPDAGLSLKGIADALEEAEVAARKRLATPRLGQPRPGFDEPDPWYDGRSPLHDFTIVDAPYSGTVLCDVEFLAVLRNIGNLSEVDFTP